jgi:diguanylate cyclase (GGDEF)-like protein/PAS domain S-box-containing protein
MSSKRIVSDSTHPISGRSLASLQGRIAAVVLALVTVPLLVAALLGGLFLAGQLRQESHGRLLAASYRVRDGVDAYLARHEAALQALAAHGEIPPVSLTNTASSYSGFLALLVTRADGRVEYSFRRNEAGAPPPPDVEASLAGRDYFREPLQTQQPFVSPVLPGAPGGRVPIAAISVPRFDASGQFAGVVTAFLDLSHLPLLSDPAPDSPAIALHDGTGAVVASAGPKLDPPPGSDPSLAVHLPLARGGWTVVASLAAGAVGNRVRDFSLLAGLLLLAAGSVAWWVARRMAGALSQSLATLARHLRQYDPASPASPPAGLDLGIEELAQLHSALQRLTRRLAESRRDSRAQLAALEGQLSESAARLAASEARSFQLLHRSTDIVYSTGPTGVLTSYNEVFERLFGPVPPGAKIQRWVHPSSRFPFQKSAVEQMRTRTGMVEVEFAVVRPNGDTCWLAQTNRLLLDLNGDVIGFQAIAQDITKQRRASIAQREAEERYALAVRGSKNGIWDWDIRTGSVYYSPRWREMFGIPPGAPCDTPEAWFTRVHPGDARALQADLASFRRHGDIELFESEHRIQHADGTWRWVVVCAAAVRGADGRALRLAGSASDVTAGKLVDPLTGLPNRLAAIERLEQLIARQSEDPNRPFALLFMDLDRFKIVNDSLGHVKGDHLLLGVSHRLLAALDQVDGAVGFVGRLGGDEFVAVLDDAPAGRVAIAVAQAVQRAMQAPFALDGSLLFASASIGIAISDSSQTSAEDLLRNADTAMYHAKSAGRGKYRIFDSSMRASAVARLALETDLRRALEDGEFELFYQAQVDLNSGRLAGFESLIRWRHPTRGLLQPDEFIHAAEENGLILPLGRWVLEQACRQLAVWEARLPACRDLSVSINLSTLQFNDPKLSTLVGSVLAETRIAPHRLHLEVTETMLAADPDVARSLLGELAAMGVALEVDDFGTGYSCLGQLHQLPFNTVKVDRSFVQAMDLEQNPQQEGRKIVESIVNLSGNLGISVIAEGIENEEHWYQLARLGCNIGQGYYFSRPVDADSAFELAGLRLSQPWPVPPSLHSNSATLIQLEQSLRQVSPKHQSPPRETQAD